MNMSRKVWNISSMKQKTNFNKFKNPGCFPPVSFNPLSAKK